MSDQLGSRQSRPPDRGNLTTPVLGAVCAVVVLVTLALAASPPLVSGRRDVTTTADPTADPQVPAGCGSVSDRLVPACGAWFGVYAPASAANGWDHAEPVARIEARIGRRFDVVHRYHDFSEVGSNGAFPDAYERRQSDEGRLLFFAWESRIFSTGTTLRWDEVYGGRWDATIDAAARRIRALERPVFLGFDHEPEDEPAKGTDAEFVRAWRHVHDRFARAGADNAVWVWTMMGWSGHYGRYADLYPGDRYVDWIGYDPYNFYACNGGRTWKSPMTTVGGFYRWLDEHRIGAGKPRMLAEYGTNFDVADPTAKRRWFEEFPAAVKAHPKIKAVLYFNSAGSTARSSACDMTMDHDASALSGFRAAARDPYFRQPMTTGG